LFAAMVFMAASFSLKVSREGGYAKVVMFSAAAGFGVYFFSDVTKVLGTAGTLPVLLAASAPAIAAILIGMTLLFNQEDG
jgi:lipopolysaccharide export system permease protein